MVSKNLIEELLTEGLPQGSSILKIQCALKLLGYMSMPHLKQCTGKWNITTERAIMALNWHLFKREDATINYDKITELLLDKNWFKLPYVENPIEENTKIKEYIKENRFNIIQIYKVPFDFLWAILEQETNVSHYDKDGFLYLSCNMPLRDKYKYQSRGYGLGQIVFKTHPLTPEQQYLISTPFKNLETSANLLKRKFDLYGRKQCKYTRQFLNKCIECIKLLNKVDITLPQATLYPKIQKEGLKDVPFPTYCDWSLAVERYKGSGSNATAYKYLILKKMGGCDEKT